MKINLKKIITGALLIASVMSCSAAPKFNSKKSISVLSREDGSRTRGAFIELFNTDKLNKLQVEKIFTGNITKWNDLK